MAEIKINKEKCRACGICISVCPKNIIEIENKFVNEAGSHYAKFEDSEHKCIGCAMCANSCPHLAIYEVTK